MIIIYSHLTWFLYLSISCLLSLVLCLYVVCNGSIIVGLSLFSFSIAPIYLSFSFDAMSCIFISVVLIISTVIIVYSFNYINPYSKSNYFLWLTVLFVSSMLLVVTMSNLFFIMLGWDGLGLVSFFLIVYYQNQSSVSSGLFTLLINRIGDCFFLVSIPLFYFSLPSQGSWFVSSVPTLQISVLMLLTFITNSAIFPFSPWLPIAIAAPTPISALVHSSTLVTAGLYLTMRYSHVILSSASLGSIFTCLSVFTSLYAGVNSVFERDLNNMIALSTLSHLGFISLSLSCGFITLAFFHLLTHALFNSLLFIAIGDIIINLSHIQDIRFLSSGKVLTPSSSSFMILSSINLLGLPMMSGFFSNDLVLETLFFSNVGVLITFIVYLNVALTFFYTLQLSVFNFQTCNSTPYHLVHKPSILHTVLLLSISFISILFGWFFINSICWSLIFQAVPTQIKFIPLSLMFLIVLSLVSFTSQLSPNSPLMSFVFSSISLLSFVCMPLASNAILLLSVNVTNLSETGLFNYSLNYSLSSQVAFIASNALTQTVSSPLVVSVISTSLVFLSVLA